MACLLNTLEESGCHSMPQNFPKSMNGELMAVSGLGPTSTGIDHQKPRLTGLKSESCFLWVFHIYVKVTITDALR